MAAEEHLGMQFVFHGTMDRWTGLSAPHPDRPFHVTSDPEHAADYSEGEGRGTIAIFSLNPDAKIHRTDSQHLGIEQPLEAEEHEMVLREGYDATMFNEGDTGVVWNKKALVSHGAISHRDYRNNPGKYRHLFQSGQTQTEHYLRRQGQR